MDPTRLLAIAVGLAALLGAYRLARWYWRPSLELGESVSIRAGSDGAWACLDVRNSGRRTARRCRASRLRLDWWDGRAWRRHEPAGEGSGLDWEGRGGRAAISAGATLSLRVVALGNLAPGQYRVTVAVVDGHERSGTYVFDAPDAGPRGAPDAGPRGPAEAEEQDS